MIFPKGVLVSRALAGFRRAERFGTQESEMPISNPYFTTLYISFINLTTRVSGKSATEGSLEITEFDNGDRRFSVTFEVARLGDQEIHHLLARG